MNSFFAKYPPAGNNAILTDTILDYPRNDTSTFIFIIRSPYSEYCQTCMSFWHKYDMDTLGDKGIIDVSYDGGNSWFLLDDTIAPPFGSFFQWGNDFHASNGSTTTHKLIISGRSDGWIQSTFCWNWFIATRQEKNDTIILDPDSLMISFTFISDSVSKSREGWMLDEFVASETSFENCPGGIKENSVKENISVYPDPTTNTLTIETLKTEVGSLQETVIEISNIQGQLIKSLDTKGNKTNIDVSFFPSGVYVVEVRTEKGIEVRKFVKE